MALVANSYPMANGVRERATPDPRVLADAIDARESVYRILVVKDRGDGEAELFTGTGFAIGVREDRCLVLTNDHVLRIEGEGFVDSRDGLFVRKMCYTYTGGSRVREYVGRVLYTDQISDLAMIEAIGLTEVTPLRFDNSPFVLGRTAISVGYSDVPEHGMTRTPAVSPGITTSHPYLSAEGARKRVLSTARLYVT